MGPMGEGRESLLKRKDQQGWPCTKQVKIVVFNIEKQYFAFLQNELS
jgi:hypothetical protein